MVRVERLPLLKLKRPRTKSWWINYFARKYAIFALLDLFLNSEKQIQDLKDTYEAVTTSYDDIKDKKIIELAK